VNPHSPLHREQDDRVCDWSQEEFDHWERAALRYVERNEKEGER
jgi:hypothetical protein